MAKERTAMMDLTMVARSSKVSCAMGGMRTMSSSCVLRPSRGVELPSTSRTGATVSGRRTSSTFSAPTVRTRAWADTGLALSEMVRTEPANALSVPTWFVHTSSVWEWVVAMQLVACYARVSGEKAYYRLCYGMLPLHASSLCAVTYHFFYNAPELNSLVTLQAALTCVGNTTLLLAAYHIYNTEISGEASTASAADAEELEEADEDGDNTGGLFFPSEVEVASFLRDRDAAVESALGFGLKAFAVCLSSALAVKYGSLLIPLPFHPSEAWAAAIIVAPTIVLGLDILRQDKLLAK